jgi:hypothetical protein
MTTAQIPISNLEYFRGNLLSHEVRTAVQSGADAVHGGNIQAGGPFTQVGNRPLPTDILSL